MRRLAVSLHNLEAIVTFGYQGPSPALMGGLCTTKYRSKLLIRQWPFLARVSGEVRGNVTLRKQQYRLSENDGEAIKVARNCILNGV